MSSPALFHPVIDAWFRRAFGEPTDVQKQAWSKIVAGDHTLIAAPTGSGKTLAALLPCLDRIVRSKAGQGEERRSRGVRVLYVTPLKALNNDIHHHMFRFAAELSATARDLAADWPGFSIGIRTGDTSQSTRASMLRNPPDLLVTTPESLYLMVTSQKAREILRTVELVIVDEIHDLAADRRGVHLSLSLERLADLCGCNPQRIGVSATQKPLERVARFLGGWEQGDAPQSHGTGAPSLYGQPLPRLVSIVESAMERRLRLQVTMPAKSVRAMDKEAVWTPLVERLLAAMEDSKAVLIFVNNRRLCERLTLRLNDYVGYEMARSHHGSISREKRLEVESLLKGGELRCLVATATLELGIDVGHVDLVLQVDSPKEAAAGIQRIGRAGHAVGGISRGIMVIRSRGDLPEAAVLAKAITERDIEEIHIPIGPLDVLAQHTVAAVAAALGDAEEGHGLWTPEELFGLFTRSDCYRGFPYERYIAMLQVLSGMFPFVRPLIQWDRERNLLGRVPASAMAAAMGGGTIMQSSAFPVHHAESRIHLGELDEEFVHESRVGDVFQLGTGSWAIQSIRQDRIYVVESNNPLSEIPFWRAEAGGRSLEVGGRMGMLLAETRDVCRLDPEGAEGQAAVQALTARLMTENCLDADAAAELLSYVRSQDKSSYVPTDTLIPVEHYKDDAGRHHLVIHSLLGRRINRTWEMALRARFDLLCSTQVYSNAKDDGLELVLPDWDNSWLAEINRLTPSQIEQSLWEALPGTSMFGKAFRHIAETSLLLAKGFERQPSWKKRLLSENLLKEALPFADRFPFLREAYAVCLEEYLDVPGLFRVLEAVSSGKMMLHGTDMLAPSPFAMRFMNDYALTALYESDALGRDIQMRLANVNRNLAADWFGPDGLRSLISPRSMETVREQLQRPGWLKGMQLGGDTADSGSGQAAQALLRLLKEQGDLTGPELAVLWQHEESGTTGVDELLAALEQQAKVLHIPLAKDIRWISRDEEEWYEAFPYSWEAVQFIVRRYMERQLSFCASDLADRFGTEQQVVESWLDRWQAEGVVEPAPFAGPEQAGLYSTSKVAQRIMRASISDFRISHGAADPVRYGAGLLEIHHLTPSLRLSGAQGLLEIIGQLQGMFLPLSLWEGTLFPSRLTDYRKELLDQLCAAGEVFWIGRKETGEREGKVAFYQADNRQLADPAIRAVMEGPGCSQPELLALLQRKGASFLSALARETGELPSALLPKLLELTWEGRVANDQFSPLRTPLAVKGKPATGKTRDFQSGLGRWYALSTGEESRGAVEATALQYCKHWISQFGILTRTVAANGSPFTWEQLSAVLKRLEEWGMVTRGFFVRGIPAMQYSTKEQVERLQSAPVVSTGDPVVVSAADPANPFGAWIDWPEQKGVQFTRKPGNFLVYDGGRWLLWIENFGKHIVQIPQSLEARDSSGTEAARVELPPSDDTLIRSLLPNVLQTLIVRYHLRKITIERWNGSRCSESEISGQLMSMGGERDRETYVFWPSSLKNR